jgi:membrane protein YqaA with SNARE-associated domain
VLDSSFLFVPFGNDLLLVGLAARHPGRMPYYAAMAALGSVAGSALTDWVSRKGGEKGLSHLLRPSQLQYVKRRLDKDIRWSLVVACVMPPPFPFTAFVVAAAAFQYPRKVLLAVIAGARFFRFCVVGMAAIILGRRILRIANGPLVRYLVLGLIIITVAGSAVSIYLQLRHRKRHRLEPESEIAPAAD